MVRRPNPLIPPSLFRRRNFTVINLSTFLIYGALYVTQCFTSLFLQNVLGYTALAASIVGLPSALLLIFGSTRAGALAGRIGARRFLIIGPIIMAVGQLWWLLVPATSQPWKIDPGNPGSAAPPVDVFLGPLPATILFGIGITLIVAPLTTALMNSVPVARAGLGSAINNAVSRIGQPLILALLFIAISSVFYSAVSSQVPGLDTSSAEVQQQLQPLNPVQRVTAPGGPDRRPGCLDAVLPSGDAGVCAAPGGRRGRQRVRIASRRAVERGRRRAGCAGRDAGRGPACGGLNVRCS